MKRRAPNPPRVLLGLGLALLFLPFAAPRLGADTQVNSMPVGGVIKGFVMPQLNNLGELTANITGEQAKVVSQSRIEITGLRVELFEKPVGNGDSKPDPSTVITSPFCDFWSQEKRIVSNRGVVVSRPDSVITADAVEWDSKNQTVLLRQNVKVVLSRFTLGVPPAPVAPSAPVSPSKPKDDAAPPLPAS